VAGEFLSVDEATLLGCLRAMSALPCIVMGLLVPKEHVDLVRFPCRIVKCDVSCCQALACS